MLLRESLCTCISERRRRADRGGKKKKEKKNLSHGFKIVKIIVCSFYYEECDDIHCVAFAQGDDDDLQGSI